MKWLKFLKMSNYSVIWIFVQPTYIRTASLDLSALTNSASASANLPSSSRYMACFRWISGSLFFIAIRDNSNANSNALQID